MSATVVRDYRRIGAGRVRTATETAETRRRLAALWRRADYTRGTPAERYVIGRGLPWLIECRALRFLAGCPHPSHCAPLPAMVAMIQDAAGNLIGLHRIFLTVTGNKAAVDPVKATLGHIAGGAIRLHPPCAEMVVGEGIETTAAAARLTGLPGWSAVAAGNLARSMVLPELVRSVVIAVDRDPAGERAAREAAWRWQREGRRVRLMVPDLEGEDANDILIRETQHAA